MRLDKARSTFFAGELIDVARRRIRSESDILLEPSLEDRGDHLDVIFIALFFLDDTRKYQCLSESRCICFFCDLLIKFRQKLVDETLKTPRDEYLMSIWIEVSLE